MHASRLPISAHDVTAGDVQAWVIAAIMGLAAASSGAETEGGDMADLKQLERAWVEVAEEGGDERIVLRPLDYPVPPSRGGRRRLDLSASGKAERRGYGPTDGYEVKGTGSWTVEDDTLRLELENWDGTYLIEELGDEILVLRRR